MSRERVQWVHASDPDTEDLLASTEAKGFPIISNDEKRLLLGYIGRTELRYVIGTQIPLSPLAEAQGRPARSLRDMFSRDRQGTQAPIARAGHAVFLCLGSRRSRRG